VLLNGAQILTGGSPSQQSASTPPVTAGTPNDPTGTEDRWTEIFAGNQL